MGIAEAAACLQAPHQEPQGNPVTSKILPSLVLLLAATFSAATFAQLKTVTYRGIVTDVVGAQPNSLRTGQPIVVSYTLDPAVADILPATDAGQFMFAMKNITISLPDAPFRVVAENGTVQTYNLPTQDTLMVYSYLNGVTQTDYLEGLPVLSARVDFLDTEAGPGGTPIMLSSDAMPLAAVYGNYSFAILTTSAGQTLVFFVADPAPTVADLLRDGKASIAAFVSSGALNPGFGKLLTALLTSIGTADAAGNRAKACEAWKAFSTFVTMLPLNTVGPSARLELKALAISLREALGGC